MDIQANQELPLRPASLAALFAVCFRVGILSFGGGLSGWLYQEFVRKRNWISEDDFASSLAISQMLPGANVVNLVVCMGEQLRGPLGSLACIFGFLVGPFFAVIAMSAIVAKISNASDLEAALIGVAAAATGLLVVVGWRGVVRAYRQWWTLAVVAVVVMAVGVLQWPLLPVVACVAPVSIAISWKRRSIDAR
ncbi:chromate transporter [Rhizobium binxianense]